MNTYKRFRFGDFDYVSTNRTIEVRFSVFKDDEDRVACVQYHNMRTRKDYDKLPKWLHGQGRGYPYLLSRGINYIKGIAHIYYLVPGSYWTQTNFLRVPFGEDIPIIPQLIS